nr:MAG TPA: Protein of unknown function (DUF3789) [Caudoviricetes sp.]
MMRDFIISAVSAMVGGLISVVIMACILVDRGGDDEHQKSH